MFFFNKFTTQNIFLKELQKYHNNCLMIKKIVVSISLVHISKVQNYTILQSICLLDTVTGQKPTLKISAYKYNLGNKSLTYSCKTILRNKNIIYFLQFFNSIFLSEMKRRYIDCNSCFNSSNHYSFSFNTVNIFNKLDEFYFKWNTSIVFNIVFNNNIFSDFFIKSYINLIFHKHIEIDA